MNYEICVIGTKAFLFPFLQFGFTTYTPPNEEALREYLTAAVEKNYGIIYIEDPFCFWVKDIIDKCRHRLTPVFIPIGENGEGESFYRKSVDEMMENAIGMKVI